MTEVTSENFEEQFPVICDNIRRSNFVAIDCEFTGLVAEGYLEPSLFDTPAARYDKQRTSAARYCVCQFGLSTFTKDPNANRFDAKSYTFYLCPRSESGSDSKKLLLNANTIEFLCDHGFDFQKWLAAGIPFVNRTEERQFVKKWKSQDLVKEVLDDMDDRSDQMHSLIFRVKQFSDNVNEQELLLPFNQSVNQLRNIAIVRTLRSAFPKISFQIVNGHIMVKKIKQDDDSDTTEEAAVEYIKGFSRIVEVLIESKKIIVGHNTMVDLLCMYQHFVNPLPRSLKQFKCDLARTFPLVYDTKTLYHDMKNEYPEFKALMDNNSGVHDLFGRLSSKEYNNFFLYSPTVEQRTDENAITEHPLKKHDAGSDAFACGFVFIKLAHTLIMLEERSPETPPTWIQYTIALEPYVNRINLIRAATNHINLAGDDEISPRPPWIYVRKLKGNLDLSEVLMLIGRFGRLDGRQIGKQEALIASGNFATALEVIEELKRTGSYDVKIYNIWQHNKCLRKYNSGWQFVFGWNLNTEDAIVISIGKAEHRLKDEP